jgi:NADH-quinone oxidoreductase subunit F
MVAQVAESIVLAGEPVRSLDEYRRRGGCRAFEQVQRSRPDEIIELIRRAGLRGRGGAGFPTALKWQSLRAIDARTKYMVCNAAEGEPGTFKDRYLLRHNPYQLLEGLAIAQHVIGAKAAFIGVKQLFRPMLEGLERALAELQAETPVAADIEIVWGPDEYLFGEEKALVNVIDGGLPMPRVLPPYMHGLFTGAYGGPGEEYSNPTCVNNVETLSHVTHIVERGPEWFRGYGTGETPGTMVFSVLGDVQRPFVREYPLGMTVRQLVEQAGGVPEGRAIKAPATSSPATCSTCRWDSIQCARRARRSAPAASSSATTPSAWCKRCRCLRTSCTSSRATSARHARSARAGSRGGWRS